jgi:hypothetical protein
VVAPGDVISYIEMCQEESASLQRGMNFRLRANISVILMSLRRGAPYADRIEDDGKTLIYEGHDLPRKMGGPNPKKVDQPRTLPSGKLTQNGLFFDAATRTKLGQARPSRSEYTKRLETVFGCTLDGSMRGKKIAVGGKSSNSNLSRVLTWSAWKRTRNENCHTTDLFLQR